VLRAAGVSIRDAYIEVALLKAEIARPVDQLNDVLLKKGHEDKLVKLEKVRGQSSLASTARKPRVRKVRVRCRSVALLFPDEELPPVFARCYAERSGSCSDALIASSRSWSETPST
jgi:hypothetical protein